MPEIPAQSRLTRAEAARLNGAKSRGPRTPEGKARSARNALKHGLTAQAFALLPGEDAQAYARLLEGLARRYRPADELAAHLVQRLASVMWRQQRADRLEAEVLSQLEQRHDSSYIGGYVPSSPRTWDAARFSAVQRQQARLDHAFFRLQGELDRLTPADDEGRGGIAKRTRGRGDRGRGARERRRGKAKRTQPDRRHGRGHPARGRACCRRHPAPRPCAAGGAGGAGRRGAAARRGPGQAGQRLPARPRALLAEDGGSLGGA